MLELQIYLIKSFVNIDFNQNFRCQIRIYYNKKLKKTVFLVLFNNIKFFIKNSTTIPVIHNFPTFLFVNNIHEPS